jgi:hypothetical protein
MGVEITTNRVTVALEEVQLDQIRALVQVGAAPGAVRAVPAFRRPATQLHAFPLRGQPGAAPEGQAKRAGPACGPFGGGGLAGGAAGGEDLADQAAVGGLGDAVGLPGCGDLAVQVVVHGNHLAFSAEFLVKPDCATRKQARQRPTYPFAGGPASGQDYPRRGSGVGKSLLSLV